MNSTTPPNTLPIRAGQTLRSKLSGLWYIHNVSRKTGVVRMEQITEAGYRTGNIIATKTSHFPADAWSLHKEAEIGFALERITSAVRYVPHALGACVLLVRNVLNLFEG
ncbi:hypothetical protein [Spirosoma foliorum]|uniref:Uncharacterized protein n=1 Tax=Spirosoma foliorum TaxID=2710596 RepID=A0A7G5H2M9_9BACT|nr:hypothetical protein [Spirosoma foliorum]QMW05371.1 hypothetical protein H3H32_11000 [Spirosoma foliorum]